ncbi:NTP transferase domain-containing protein [Glacieibacterium sp.]|uniref:phosphocholine cytidylyltransferase family protein n=1 Tax=Glacieibacterium sp. TaxID=2860237 RepID=UPI003AFFA5FE
MTMHAIILSAGQGSRLAPLTAETPKCLIDFHGLSLLEWQLAALAEAGVGTITVVTGFQAEKVRERLAGGPFESVALVNNPFYRIADNISSVWLARAALVGGDALILNGDTLVGPALIVRAIDKAQAPVNVTTAVKSAYDADDMKVTLARGLVTAVSKKLPPGETDAESIGMLVFKGGGGARFAATVDAAISREGGTGNYYLAAVAELALLGLVGAADVTGHPSAEVDFPEDLPGATALTLSWLDEDWAQAARRSSRK